MSAEEIASNKQNRRRTALELPQVIPHSVRCHRPQKVDVIIRVEAHHVQVVDERGSLAGSRV